MPNLAAAIRVWHRKCHPAPVENFYPLAEITGTYGAAVKELLANGSVVLIEHDVDPTPEDIAKLQCAAAKEPDSVFAARYWLNPITTGIDRPVCAHRPRFGEWLEQEGTVPVAYFGLGCTYLPAELGELIEPQWDYPALDFLISQAWHDAGGRAYATPDWVVHHHG